MPSTAFRTAALCVAATAGVLVTGGCSAQTIGDQLQPLPASRAAVTPAPTSASSSGASGLSSDKLYDVKVTVNNHTGSDLRLTSASLGHADGSDGGHWDQRATDVPAGGSITTSAYSAVQGQSITLKYSSTATGQQPVTLRLVAQDPAIGSNNTNGTKVSGPMSVQSSITDGRSCTANFLITSYAGT